MKINFKHFFLYLFIIITTKESCIYSNEYPTRPVLPPDKKIPALYIATAISIAETHVENSRKNTRNAHQLIKLDRSTFEEECQLRNENYPPEWFNIYEDIYWYHANKLSNRLDPNTRRKISGHVDQMRDNPQRYIDIVKIYNDASQADLYSPPSYHDLSIAYQQYEIARQSTPATHENYYSDNPQLDTRRIAAQTAQAALYSSPAMSKAASHQIHLNIDGKWQEALQHKWDPNEEFKSSTISQTASNQNTTGTLLATIDENSIIQDIYKLLDDAKF